MASAKAAKNAEFLTDEGIRSEGMEAYSIPAIEQAALMKRKREVLYGTDAGENLSEQMFTAAQRMKNSDGSRKYSDKEILKALQDEGLVNGGEIENGQIKGAKFAQGEQLVEALASMGSMNFSSSKALFFT